MALVLVPSINEKSMDEVMQHIEEVRARRLVAAMEYVAGKNAQIQYESEKLQKKILGAYEKLGKALERLDKADEDIQKYLQAVQILQQEHGFLQDHLVEISDGEGSEDLSGAEAEREEGEEDGVDQPRSKRGAVSGRRAKR